MQCSMNIYTSKNCISQIVIALLTTVYPIMVLPTKTVTSKWTIGKIKMNEKSEKNMMRTTFSITMNTSKLLNQSYCLT